MPVKTTPLTSVLISAGQAFAFYKQPLRAHFFRSTPRRGAFVHHTYPNDRASLTPSSVARLMRLARRFSNRTTPSLTAFQLDLAISLPRNTGA